MRSYLGLVAEYAKAHKKKNRLTTVCIAISVMLVTAVFGMADMSLKAQKREAIKRYGNWHFIVHGISDDTADEMRHQRNIKTADWLGVMDDVTYRGKELVVQSSGEALVLFLAVTVGAALMTTMLAVVFPAKRIEKTNIVNVVNAV